MARWIPKRGQDIGLQLLWMQELFPDFVYHRIGRIWLGYLRPTDLSPSYRVRLECRLPKAPIVRILEPSLALEAPHRYGDGSLCLYRPSDRSWDETRIIAKTIVPWTAEWLWLYECWQDTGEWYGDEAPHCGPKRRA